MNLHEYKALLERVSYKPGWRFTVRFAGAGFAQLEIQAAVADTADPSVPRTIAISYYFNLQQFDSVRRFYAFVRACVMRTEVHEECEWFRVDGASWPVADHATF